MEAAAWGDCGSTFAIANGISDGFLYTSQQHVLDLTTEEIDLGKVDVTLTRLPAAHGWLKMALRPSSIQTKWNLRQQQLLFCRLPSL